MRAAFLPAAPTLARDSLSANSIRFASHGMHESIPTLARDSRKADLVRSEWCPDTAPTNPLAVSG